MNSDRTTDGSRRSLGAGRWARAGLVSVLLAGAPAAAAPAAPPGSSGKARDGRSAAGKAHVPPGQAKKAQPAGRADAPAAGRADAPAPGRADAPAPGRADAPAAPVAAHGAGDQAKKKDTKKNDKASRGAGRPQPAGASAVTADRTRPAEAARAPGSAAAPAAAAAAAAPAPPPAPAAAPPAPAALAVQPMASAAPRRPAGATRRSRRSARRAPQSRRMSAVRAPAGAFGARLFAAAAPSVPTAAQARKPGERAGGTAERPPERSPLTRTVVRVLEVIPPQVRMALAALALLGLLLGAATAVQTVRRRHLARQRSLLLADVGVLQSALLPVLPERIGGARVTAAYRPAAGLAAGGDFYDAFELPGGRTAVIVGDVAGHGRDAVPLTALVRYNLRAYLEAGLAPRSTLHVASNVLAPQLGGRQVTIAVAIYDPGTGRLSYACAGHWPPLLVGAEAPLVTACSSPPIGAGAPTGRRQTTVALAPGMRACFHTDGLAEVRTGRGRRLGRDGVDEELQEIGADGEAADLIDRIVRRSEDQPDDMAACIITALPGGAEHWSLRLEELEADAEMLRAGWVEQFLLACGVGSAHIEKALGETRQMIGIAGTAIVEVRVGEQLVEVRVGPPPAVSMPIASSRVPDAGVALTA